MARINTKHLKQKHIGKPGKPLHPLLLDRFRRIMEHGMNPSEPDLGVAPIGTLRPLIGGFFDGRKAAYLQSCWAHDRTLKEWLELIDENKRMPSLFWNIPLNSPENPWRQYMTLGQDIETFFYKNQRLRWIVRKWIARVRAKILRRKLIGETDFFSLNPIPENQRIYIQDIKNKCTYVFNAYSIIKSIQTQLKYSNYGFPEPKMPINPYTNIPFGVHQISSIISQCANVFMLVHKFFPVLIIKFRTAFYDINRFLRNEKTQLQISAAISFFNNKYDTEVNIVLVETYDELMNEFQTKPRGYIQGRRCLCNKTIQDYDKWVDILTSYWIRLMHRSEWKYTIPQIKAKCIELLVNMRMRTNNSINQSEDTESE